MTERNPPSWLAGGSHPAEHDRLLVASLIGAGSGEGVVSGGDLAVTQNGTPNMSVNIAAGSAFVRNDLAAFGGTYHVVNDGTVNRAISAADPTNPRRDLVVVRIRDAAYFGATNSWDLFVITGTPAASPVDPTIPSDGSYLLLARVAVAAGATSITNANITDLRAFVFSGVQSRRYTTPGGTTSGTAVLTLFTIALPAQGLPFVAKFDFAAIFTQSVATDAFDMVASNNLDAQARHFRPFRSTTGNFTALGAGLFEFSGASPVTLSFTIARNSGSGTATVNADGRFSFVDLLVLKPARSI